MKEKYFINARIIDPSQNLDEVGGVIVDQNGKYIEIKDHSPGLALMKIGPNAIYNGYTDAQASEKKIIKREEKQEQAVVDNRTQGDRTNKIYQSYYGIVRSMLDSNKKYEVNVINSMNRQTNVWLVCIV